MMGEMGNAYKILVRKLNGTRQFGKLKCRWENNIKMDLKEMRLRTQALSNMVINLWVL
jgi:hypothetical protein